MLVMSPPQGTGCGPKGQIPGGQITSVCPFKPPIKHFRPFLLIVWLCHATHQAFRAIFAYRLAQSCHPSSIFAHFCLSSGSVMPPIKHFGPFLLIVWLCHATHQAFRAVFAYRLAYWGTVGIDDAHEKPTPHRITNCSAVAIYHRPAASGSAPRKGCSARRTSLACSGWGCLCGTTRA